MSRENQSVSGAIEANCGASIATLNHPAADVGAARDKAAESLEAAIACLRAWLDGEGTDANLSATTMAAPFCDALTLVLESGNLALAEVARELPDQLAEPWYVIGGAIDLLRAVAVSNKLTPLAGVALLRLLWGAHRDLLADHSGVGEVLQ